MSELQRVFLAIPGPRGRPGPPGAPGAAGDRGGIFAVLNPNAIDGFYGNRRAGFAIGGADNYVLITDTFFPDIIFRAVGGARTITRLQVWEQPTAGGAPAAFGSAATFTFWGSTDGGVTYALLGAGISWGGTETDSDSGPLSIAVPDGTIVALVYENAGVNVTPANVAALNAIILLE